MFANVILPLPLNGLFTYSLTDIGGRSVVPGMRVSVPFGRKQYVGIVHSLTDNPPEKISKIKSIADVLDATPSVTGSQLKLWEWISDYYLSSIGDVMKAALPSCLKSQDGYKPKMEQCVGLPEKLCDERALHLVIDALTRAPQQLKTFTAFLEITGFDRISNQQATTHRHPLITRDELLNASGQGLAPIRALIEKGFLYASEREVGRLNFSAPPHPELINKLNIHQQKAMEDIREAFTHQQVALLHGVTSSGKTEVYIHLMQEQIEQGRQVLFLLPEIALTVQIMQRLHRIFGSRMGIYHSKYSEAERAEVWLKQLSDHPYDIILGARSAVFLPMKRLGLVIVDEEHEASYKQQDPAPRYNGRDVATVMAQMCGAKVLLGSATPCAESLYNVQAGKYGYATLTHRYQDILMPKIEIVDVADLQRRKIMRSSFSPRLVESIAESLENGQQAILFQNRRGFAPIVECRECGWVPRCSSCDVSLTYHKAMNMLSCHYCGQTYAMPTVCPMCGSRHLVSKGLGTEKIEDMIEQLFPQARVARMDLDTTHTRSAYERIIADFSAGRTNILIGTQMISKGLDFANVAVVGIIDADTMLNYPDFRAHEHAFMMMTQVSGRAGRQGRQGLVILQTKHPEEPLIKQVVDNDNSAFMKVNLAERRLFHYPPYYRLIYVYLRHKSDTIVEQAAQEMSQMLRGILTNRVLGPDKPAVARVKTMNIRKIIIKLEPGIPLPEVRKHLLQLQSDILGKRNYSSLQIYYDVDPV